MSNFVRANSSADFNIVKNDDPTAFFWKIGERLLKDEGITKGKILGFPCLRFRGEFLATAEHRTGDLIVKLPVDRVSKVIDQGKGEAFAPAGRRFKEWLRVEKRDSRFWKKLISESKTFARANA